MYHVDVIKRKHFLRYWPFVRGIHRSPVNSPYKAQSRGALMFSLICARMNGWVNNRDPGDLGDWRRAYRAHFDVTVMEVVVEGVFCFITSFFVLLNHDLPWIWGLFSIYTLRPSEQGIGQWEKHLLTLAEDVLRWPGITHRLWRRLTHWGREKDGRQFHDDISNAFPWMKIYKSTIFSIGSDKAKSG